jgi:hypothetical protein
MRERKYLIIANCVLAVVFIAGCRTGKTNSPKNAQSGTDPVATQPSERGIEKVKPAAGTGNVQGKVLYNSKPVENIEVKLCEKFNRYFGGCEGKTFMARTDKDGEYVITNVKPAVYEALLARVFDTDAFVFATSGIAGLSSAKYEVNADKTLFITPTNLFKGDLKATNPKAGAKVSGKNLELKWEAYPDAAYYKFSIYPDDSSTTSPYINERIEATSIALDKPLEKGTYRWQVQAFNDADRKLSESGDDIKFTVTDSAAK